MKRTFILVNLILLVDLIYTFSFAQAPEIQWQNTIGGSDGDYLHSVIQTTDGGYLLGGSSYSGKSGDKTEESQGDADYWVIKLDGSGNIEWQNTIGGKDNDYLRCIIQTTDSGYFLGGYSDSGKSGDKTEKSQGCLDYWVIKLDGSGNIEWQNTIGGSGTDDLHSVIQTTDGGYLLGGYSYSNKSGDKTEDRQGSYDYWVIKLDGSGNIEWQNTIGGSGTDYLHSVIQTTDGGYFLGGGSSSGISGDKTEVSQGSEDYWVIKLDGSGNIEWQNTIGGKDNDYLRCIIQTTDSGYFLGGYSDSGKSGDKTEKSQGGLDYWVIKLDGSGNIEWQNTIGGSKEDYLNSVIQTTDSGYFLGGYSDSGESSDKTEKREGGYDYWVIKLDGSGNIEWQNTIGGSDSDELYSVIQTTDGGYLLGGWSYTGKSGDKTEESQGSNDYWVLTLAPEVISCSTPYGGYTTNITAKSATVNWLNSSNAATGYRIYYKEKNTSGWTKAHAKGTTLSKTLKGLQPNTPYVWQVAAKCDTIHSDFSEHFEFTTQLEKESFPANFSTFNFIISPNPTNGDVAITATFPYEESLIIRVVDVVGREVYTENVGIVNGSFSRHLDLSNLIPGSYFIQLIHNEQTEVRKLLIVK